MTRDSIIAELTANVKAYQQLAYNIASKQNPDDADDLFQTCFLMLLEFPEARLISYYNPTQGLKPIFIRMLCNQYKSSTSKFHKDYRKQESDLKKKASDIILNAPQSEEEIEQDFFLKIEKACKGLYLNAGNIVLADILKTTWEGYIETGSLRKTLLGTPVQYANLLDLKAVHVIVKKFQRCIKGFI